MEKIVDFVFGGSPDGAAVNRQGEIRVTVAAASGRRAAPLRSGGTRRLEAAATSTCSLLKDWSALK
jgi:hypothetical protein